MTYRELLKRISREMAEDDDDDDDDDEDSDSSENVSEAIDKINELVGAAEFKAFVNSAFIVAIGSSSSLR